MDTLAKRKERGAFFHSALEISRYLMNWAIQSPDAVLGAVLRRRSFLLAAGERLRTLDARPLIWSSQLQGVEIHEDSAIAAQTLMRAAGFDASVTRFDFFDFDDRQKFERA
ncbi:MAG: hypothetical protein R3D99_08240 [Altererythrobacter sp.]